jgi:hypothetical protein
MTIQFEVPVHCLADLRLVDSRVRALCNTTSGAQCQSMLTTEYQCWRRNVALWLLQGCVDARSPPQGAVDAYMNGFRLRFAPPTCVITQSLPSTAAVSADGLRKRKSHCAPDVLSDVL